MPSLDALVSIKHLTAALPCTCPVHSTVQPSLRIQGPDPKQHLASCLPAPATPSPPCPLTGSCTRPSSALFFACRTVSHSRTTSLIDLGPSWILAPRCKQAVAITCSRGATTGQGQRHERVVKHL